MRQSRREFLKQCGAISAGAICGGSLFLLEGCAGFRQVTYRVDADRFVVPKKEFLEFPSAVLRSPDLPAPVFIARGDDQNYSAVLLECTHRQCEVEPSGTLLICPCHGSEYSLTGEVLAPPAEKNLYRFAVSTDAENIYIAAE